MRAATADVIAWQDHGDTKARARAIQSVEDMVWKLARRTHRRVGRLGVDIEDLVAAGWEGATIATNRFDASRGVDFAACARPSITERIERFARHASGVASIPQSNVAYRLEVVVNRATMDAENAGLTPNQAIEHAATVAGVSAVDAAAISRRSHAVSYEQEKHDHGSLADDGHEASVTRLLTDCLAELK